LLNTAMQDGTQVRVRFGKDPGQAGKSQALHLVARLVASPSPRPQRVVARSRGSAGSVRIAPNSCKSDWRHTSSLLPVLRPI
jgi:hypothetical protein